MDSNIVKFYVKDTTIYIDLGIDSDIIKYINKQKKELQEKQNKYKKLKELLDNKDFREKAKPEIIEQYKNDYAELGNYLNNIDTRAFEENPLLWEEEYYLHKFVLENSNCFYKIYDYVSKKLEEIYKESGDALDNEDWDLYLVMDYKYNFYNEIYKQLLDVYIIWIKNNDIK